MKYIFNKVEREFENSQNKIKEIYLYSNDGKFNSADRYLGSIIFYKDGTKQFECRSIAKYIVSPEEIKFIAGNI